MKLPIGIKLVKAEAVPAQKGFPLPLAAAAALFSVAPNAGAEPTFSVSAPIVRRKIAPALTGEELQQLQKAAKDAAATLRSFPTMFEVTTEKRDEFFRVFGLIDGLKAYEIGKALQVLCPTLESYGKHGVRPCVYIHGPALTDKIAALAKTGAVAWQLCGKDCYLIYPRQAVSLSSTWVIDILRRVPGAVEYGVTLEFPLA
ncbi:MAG: hypothetical protein ABW007_19030 [Chitinophagaceae bacterium]